MKWTRYIYMWIPGMLCIMGCKHQTAEIIFGRGEWVDMSHAYDASTVYWPTAEGFLLDTVFEGMTEGGYYYSAFAFSTAEHGGTHIDAPIHFAQGKRTVDEIPLDQLTGEAIVIDVSDSSLLDIDYLISVEDLQEWEGDYGRIPDDAIVLFRTGYEKFWPDRRKYMGTDKRGIDAVRLLHFPGLSADAAQWLVRERDIKAVGIDTPSIDFGRSSDFRAHRILFAANIPAFENLANMAELPERGAYVVALPMKIRGGSGGPLRIAAFVPEGVED